MRAAGVRQIDGAVGVQALVLTGEPGIGKSALLAAAEAAARAGGYRVLAASGVESEGQLPFAGLHQLLRPILRTTQQQLRPAHRRALLAAFGLEESPPPEPFLIALAAVNVLAAVAADQPVAVLADDVQWLDPQSQEVLTFMARRATAHPVVIIGATRAGHPGPFTAAGLPTLELADVNEAAAEEILRLSAGVLNPADRHRIRREARGNPLALLELPKPGLVQARPPTGSRRPCWRAWSGRLPAGSPGCPSAPGTRFWFAVDSASGLEEIFAAASAFSGSAVTSAAFGPAAEAGLLGTVDGQVRFRHPLVRSGVLQSETLTRRMAANAALAEVLTGEPYRQTWHRAQSIVGPDDQVADELEANAAIGVRGSRRFRLGA